MSYTATIQENKQITKKAFKTNMESESSDQLAVAAVI